MALRTSVRKSIRAINRHIPVDLIVYTSPSTSYFEIRALRFSVGLKPQERLCMKSQANAGLNRHANLGEVADVSAGPIPVRSNSTEPARRELRKQL